MRAGYEESEGGELQGEQDAHQPRQVRGDPGVDHGVRVLTCDRARATVIASSAARMGGATDRPANRLDARAAIGSRAQAASTVFSQGRQP